ncbi:amylo-alpha-1,6-glucosidase [Promicromonospora sp. NPDC090134]|uniref:amylo-alpha-1,6-glucosidase n=1 Tax=Promicromonospora sp. NPDC090134 TaxID=3364408 RepID=UPI00380CE2F4
MTDHSGVIRTARRSPLVLGLAAAVLAASMVPAGGVPPTAPATTALATTEPTGPDALQRPFALPGHVERDANGALFVGEGESRFALRVNLLTTSGRLIRENQGLLPYVADVGPVTVDGSYYEVRISSDDRTVTPDRLGAMREILAHPDDWPQEQVDQARDLLPTLESRYEQTRRDEQQIVIRFARTAPNTLVGAVTALQDDTTVFLEAAPPWGEPSSYRVTDRGIRASSPGLDDPDLTGHFALTPTRRPDSGASYASVSDLVAGMQGGDAAPGSAAAALRYTLDEDETITFTSTVSDAPASAEASTAATGQAGQGAILAALARARARADAGTLSGSGPAGRSATAMRTAMGLNANYDERFRQRFLVWGWGRGGAENDTIFTGWDSAWDAIIALTVDPELAQEHERDLFDAGGPRYDQLHSGPMHAYAVKRIYSATGDLDLVREAYPALADFIDRLPEWDVNGDGLLEAPYDADPSKVGNHLGLDDLPSYWSANRVPKDGGSGDERDNTDLTDVALTSYYALMAQTMAELADALGRDADAQRYGALFHDVKRAVNETLWNEERGMYLDRHLDGRWGDVVTGTVFYPLFGGVATDERARRTVRENLLDPEQFWGEYAVPSISRAGAEYCANGLEAPNASSSYRYYAGWNQENSCEQWRGAVWPPMNATIYDGLKRYGLDEAAGGLAARSTAMWLDTWDRNGQFPEYFDPEPGQTINASAVDSAWRYYTWSNVMPLMSVHELVAEDPWGTPGSVTFGSLVLEGRNTVDDVRVGGRTYAATVSPDGTELRQDGRQVFRAVGARVVVRDFVATDRRACFEVNAEAPARLQFFPVRGAPHRTTVDAGRTELCL